MEVTFDNPVWHKHLNKYLLTDAEGVVHLGPLDDIATVTCNLTSNTWNLIGTSRDSHPNVIQNIAGTPIQLPLGRQDIHYVRSISLFQRSPESSGVDWCFIQDCTERLRLQDGLLTIHDLAPGYYTLNINHEDQIEITVASAKASEPRIQHLDDYHIGVNPMLEVPDSAKHPLYLLPAVADDNTKVVEIQVRNWTAATRVCILATRFVPFKPMFEDLTVGEPVDPWRMTKTEKTLTTYSTGRILGEEYQYILNRKAQTNHWAGNLLSKPSVLLSPWVRIESLRIPDCLYSSETILSYYFLSPFL